MNREQMIEKVESLITYSPFGASERDDAERVLDAILPQVTTVEELEALPDNSILVTAQGYPFHWPTDRDEIRNGWTSEALPLTVVWQP